MSKLYFRYGAMNSGKSTALLQVAHNYEERDQRVILIKPSLDTKMANAVSSRIGLSRKADLLVDKDTEILPAILKNQNKDFQAIIVDEAQFLTCDQVSELWIIAVKHSIPVLCYGLRSDFQGKAFEGSARLFELAHSIKEMKTICYCGSKAVMNCRQIGGEYVFSGSQIAIDGQDAEYVSLCGACYLDAGGESQILSC